MTKPMIIGAGELQCDLCKPDSPEKDGLALEIDGAEQKFCWNHLKGMSRLWRNAWAQTPKVEQSRPLLERMGNGQ